MSVAPEIRIKILLEHHLQARCAISDLSQGFLCFAQVGAGVQRERCCSLYPSVNTCHGVSNAGSCRAAGKRKHLLSSGHCMCQQAKTSLHKEHDGSKPCNSVSALQTLWQLHCHSNICHLDISPSNVMVRKDCCNAWDSVRLIDFAFAQHFRTGNGC